MCYNAKIELLVGIGLNTKKETLKRFVYSQNKFYYMRSIDNKLSRIDYCDEISRRLSELELYISAIKSSIKNHMIVKNYIKNTISEHNDRKEFISIKVASLNVAKSLLAEFVRKKSELLLLSKHQNSILSIEDRINQMDKNLKDYILSESNLNYYIFINIQRQSRVYL